MHVSPNIYLSKLSTVVSTVYYTVHNVGKACVNDLFAKCQVSCTIFVGFNALQYNRIQQYFTYILATSHPNCFPGCHIQRHWRSALCR